MKLVEGQLIHRRYRLDSRLAQGGMGEVWKGYDIQLGRPVAIKALRGDLGVTQEAKLLRLRAEAHNSANLAHPNIAALFEYYEHDGIGFLIMEYVPSKSLADLYHEQNGPMDPIKLLPIQIFYKIVLPLSKAALASIGLMFAVSYWNDYTNYKLYITTDQSLYNFQMKLRSIIMGSDLPAANGGAAENTVTNAAVIVAILPFMILYPFLQKYFVKGINIGAVKE